MNNGDELRKYDEPEFWSKVIKEARKQAAPAVVKHAYRPVGFLVVVSLLVLVMLLDHGVPPITSILLTMLISLLVVVFS